MPLFESLSIELKDLVIEHAARSPDCIDLVKWSSLLRCGETPWRIACMTRGWNDKPQHFSWRVWYARKCKPNWAYRLDSKFLNASNNGQFDIVRLFLDRGADIHADNDWALRTASRFGHLEVARLLLDRGADIHAVDDYALRWAAEAGHLEVVRLLLDRGADIHADEDGGLQLASRNGFEEVVRFLLDRDADIHALDDWALRVASEKGHLEVMRLLLDRGANVHAGYDEALRVASYFGHLEVVRLLLDRGACKYPPKHELCASFLMKPRRSLEEKCWEDGTHTGPGCIGNHCCHGCYTFKPVANVISAFTSWLPFSSFIMPHAIPGRCLCSTSKKNPTLADKQDCWGDSVPGIIPH